jgi:hypothetical protein
MSHGANPSRRISNIAVMVYECRDGCNSEVVDGITGVDRRRPAVPAGRLLAEGGSLR